MGGTTRNTDEGEWKHDDGQHRRRRRRRRRGGGHAQNNVLCVICYYVVRSINHVCTGRICRNIGAVFYLPPGCVIIFNIITMALSGGIVSLMHLAPTYVRSGICAICMYACMYMCVCARYVREMHTYIQHTYMLLPKVKEYTYL